jgi:hypothetical protein
VDAEHSPERDQGDKGQLSKFKNKVKSESVSSQESAN